MMGVYATHTQARSHCSHRATYEGAVSENLTVVFLKAER